MTGRRTPTLALVAGFLLVAMLACSTDDLGIGRRGSQATPTPTTPAVFATATPGGLISVWLVTPPGGAAMPTSPPLQLTAPGAIVAPVGTATAVAALLSTATAQAEAPAHQPTYQSSECPAPGNPPPPARPQVFSQYPQAIARYLSAGGPTTLLEAALRSWGAITESGGMVKVDTDVTGDGVVEVIITLYDPTSADRLSEAAPGLRPGQLLIFGCDSGGYRLLYASPPDPTTSLPEFLRVGDMNSNARAEVVFYTRRCTQPDACIDEAQILSWEATLGSFQPLNQGRISAANAQFTIADVDDDGVLELVVASGGESGPNTGPTRPFTQIWDWDGQGYLLALTQTAPATYLIHAVHDADAALAAGNYPAARAAYNQALSNASLLPWGLPNERAYLNAYALYRLVLTYALQNNMGQAQAAFDRLAAEYPPGLPGESYAAIAAAFLNEYAGSRSIARACAQARNMAVTRPDALSVLNSYGTANRQYTLNDLCPY